MAVAIAVLFSLEQLERLPDRFGVGLILGTRHLLGLQEPFEVEHLYANAIDIVAGRVNSDTLPFPARERLGRPAIEVPRHLLVRVICEDPLGSGGR